MNSDILEGRLASEYKTFGHMMQIYCKGQCGQVERNDQGLCSHCQELLDYAEKKLDRCPYGETKPTCGNCPIHCYKPAEREKARHCMRYAGPRMILRHPIEAIQHLIDNRRPVPEKPPMRSARRQRQKSAPSKGE